MPEQVVLTCKTFREVPKLIIKKGKMMNDLAQNSEAKMTHREKRKTQNTEMVDANYLLQAAEKFGLLETAKAIGYEYSSVANMVKAKRCRLTVELACRFVLMQAASKEETPRAAHYVVTVPAGSDLSVLEKLAGPLGWKLTPLPV